MLRLPALRLKSPFLAQGGTSAAASRRTVEGPQLNAAPAYFERLDTVRAVAILWVFAYHFCGACWGWKTHEWQARWDESPTWLAWPGVAMTHICQMGGLGVPMFFVLSGFLIHFTFCRANQGVGQFWLRRWGRIYPPYFAALVLIALVSGQLWRARGGTNFLHHLLLIHNYRDDFIFGFNGSFWSLAIEAQYYLLYPLLLSFRRAVGMPLVVFIAFAVKLSIAMLMATGIVRASGDGAVGLLMPSRYFEWILGMYVADCFLNGRQAFAVHRSAAWLCFVAAFAANQSRWADFTVIPLISLGTAVWIDRILRVPSKPGRFEQLLFPIGVGSYSLYLWHQPIINEVVARLMRNESALASVPIAVLMLLTLLVAAALSVLVAAGCYRLLELPSIELTKRLVKRCWPQPTTAPPPALKVAA